MVVVGRVVVVVVARSAARRADSRDSLVTA